MRVATSGLIDRAARAVRWRFAGSGFGAISRITVGMLLARLLTPADFGLMALDQRRHGFHTACRRFRVLGAPSFNVPDYQIATYVPRYFFRDVRGGPGGHDDSGWLRSALWWLYTTQE